MTKINTQNKTSRSPFGDAPVSHQEVLLFCAAAFLLAAAYPFKGTVVPPQSTTTNLPVNSDTVEVVEQLSAQLESHNAALGIEPDNTTVLLKRVDSELVAEIPASEPAS